jgi:hypothetical protein
MFTFYPEFMKPLEKDLQEQKTLVGSMLKKLVQKT